jgi:dipeptidase E
MRRLLLVSSSRVHGTGYLEHCASQIKANFKQSASVLFVPYAIKDHDGYEATVAERFNELGLTLTSIHRAADPVKAVEQADGIFIGGGNSFRLLKRLYDEHLIEPIRRRVAAGMPYMGSSAGSNMACVTIKTSNDMPIVYPPSFDALQLVPFQINPHYLDPDPSSTHQGETRELRIAEFHEENATPVIGLREGSMLVIDGDSITLEGKTGAKLFLQGEPPRECEPGMQLTL